VITAIDSSVLLDVVCNDRQYADKSETAIRIASAEGSIIICECVVAEIFKTRRKIYKHSTGFPYRGSCVMSCQPSSNT